MGAQATSIMRDLWLARQREEDDDHLSTEERQSLVDRYRRMFPLAELPSDMTEAFISIIFD